VSDCNELASLIAAQPLGVLEPEDEARVAEHLALCPTCPALARRFESALEEAVPEKKKAPDAIWARLSERIERDQAAPAKHEPRVPPPAEVRRVLVLSLSLAIAATGGVAALALARRDHSTPSSAPGRGTEKTVTPPPARPEIPPAVRKALADGAAALAARARRDGWTRHVGASSPDDTGSAITALAARALAQLPPDLRKPHEPLVDRALELLLGREARTGWVTDPAGALGAPSYETYATAETLLALIARRGTENPDVTRLANGLAARQLCETTPFPDVDFSELDWQWGGFAFEDRPILHRPDARITVGGTAIALEALHAAGRGPEDAAMTRARAFVTHPRLQNFDENPDPALADALDGGFPESAITSKAGTLDAGERRINRSYGSATCDGLAALIYTGAPEARTRAAAEWIRRHFDAARMPEFPGNASGRSPFETGIRFYYIASLARALDAFGDGRFGRPWAEAILHALLVSQRSDGSWKNDEPVMNEDDEVIATSLALLALERIAPHLVKAEVPQATAAAAFVADGPIDSGFALDGSSRLLLAIGRDGAVYALDRSAQRLRWSAGGAVGQFGDTFSRPTIVGGRAYVGTTNGILTLDLESRTTAEAYPTLGSVTGAPLYFARTNRLVCGTSTGQVVAFAPPAVAPVWRNDLGAPVRLRGVALDDDGTHLGFVAEDERLHVLETETGREIWQAVAVGEPTAPPVRRGDKLFLANTGGEVVKLRFAPDFASWWRDRWKVPDSGRGVCFLDDDGPLVVATDRGNVFGLDAGSLRTLWELRGAFDAGGAAPQLGEGSHSSVVVLGRDGSGCVVSLAGWSSRIKLAPGKLTVVDDRLVISDRNGDVRFFERP
jgi:outer membrane protein assembly factor BamB